MTGDEVIGILSLRPKRVHSHFPIFMPDYLECRVNRFQTTGILLYFIVACSVTEPIPQLAFLRFN